MKSTGNRRKKRRKSKNRNLLMLGSLAIVVCIVGAFTVTRYQPTGTKTTDETWSIDNNLDTFRQLISKSRNSINRTINDGTINLDDLDSLGVTIGRLRKLIADEPAGLESTDRDQLAELQSIYEHEMGLFLHAQSLRLEREAEDLLSAGKIAEACEAQQKACNLQRKINEQFPSSSKKDHGRLHLLANRLIRWKTEPIAAKADRLRDEAIALRKNNDYEEACARMEEALELQRLLNENYRSSPHASLSRLKAFEQTGRMIQAAEDIDLLSGLIRESQKHLDAGNSAAALFAINQASEIQGIIDEKYTGLKETEATRHEEIGILKDTAASVDAFAMIGDLENRCRSLLLEKKPDAFLNAVSAWLRAADQFMDMYPKSVLAEKIDMEQLRFLHRKREAVSSVLDTVYSNLVPLHEERNVSMYRTEVPQYLYEAVMDRNPSYNKDPLLPVESVTWTEASRFTELLTWILARPVHLPDENQFRNAVGNTPLQVSEEHVWSSQSPGRTTQPVGTSKANLNRYFDLLGNVAEWLASPDEKAPAIAPLAGGSARDGLDILTSVPFETERVNQRNRFSGFRFVVDMTDQLPEHHDP